MTVKTDASEIKRTLILKTEVWLFYTAISQRTVRIVKTAGVDESILKFSTCTYIRISGCRCAGDFDGQDQRRRCCDYPLRIIERRPGMQEMLYPTSYLKSKGLGKQCALATDGRFSGGTSGLSIGHASPEAAEGGNIGLIEEGDTIHIDIPNRKIQIGVSDETLAERRKAMEAKGVKAWKPESRDRKVSQALRAYAAMTTSAAKGAVRDVSQVEK